MKNEIKFFAGIDVQIKRGCCYYIIDENKNYFESGWVTENIPQSLKEIFLKVSSNNPYKIAIGIDSPRMPIDKLRKRSFERKTNSWKNNDEGKIGRECEVIIKSYNIANPQWTRTLQNSPDWMKLGFSIYDTLTGFHFVYEVFPSASYRMLEKENIKYELCLNNFIGGVKDMLDASVGAITVYEFINGRGCEVGGEDGLGTIVLPRKIENWIADLTD
ncbi:hypothetical protein [Ignavibacterium sp.]|uniref:hypothetical protein n=1 Tax=Ignavibacterium sp. TaxID=2651167 RepID=UPI0021FB9045|nr:hypothetical protein [Ignavibacterium sp.]BDQ03593.1 MAG: hypothetical protein KatS3mg037_2168 [Ignavibacterium sp.]